MAELPDGVEHGTPEGYAAGCSRDEERCPAYWEHGMSCFFAHVRAETDVRYYRAKVRDPRPAAIAARLGFTAPAQQIAEQLRPAVDVEAEIVAYAKQKEARKREAAIAKAHPVREPIPTACPECVAGKHTNCDGTSWCQFTDQPTTCSCTHTPENTPTTQEQTMPKKTEPTTSPATKPTPPTGSGRTREELTKIRAWARQNGWEVGTSGRIQKVILDAYDKTMLLGVRPGAPGAVAEKAAAELAEQDEHAAKVEQTSAAGEPAAEPASSPVGEAADALAEVAPVGLEEPSLSEGDPETEAFEEFVAYVYADASDKLDETRERVDLPISEIPTVVGEPAVTGEAVGHAYIPGDDWAQVAISQDVERARDLAVRLEAENANLVAENSRMGGALEFALRSWAAADEQLAAEHGRARSARALRLAANRHLLGTIHRLRDQLAQSVTQNEILTAAARIDAQHITELEAELEQLRARRWWQIGGAQ